MGLTLIFIFPDCPLPVLADTNPILSLPHCCHLSMSLSLTQAAAKHSRSHLSLSPHSLLFHTQATFMRSQQPLLSLSSAPLAPPILSSGHFTNPRGSARPGLKMALELEQGWPWPPMAPKLGGAPSLQGKRQDTVVTVASGRTKTRAGVSRETGRKGGT